LIQKKTLQPRGLQGFSGERGI